MISTLTLFVLRRDRRLSTVGAPILYFAKDVLTLFVLRALLLKPCTMSIHILLSQIAHLSGYKCVRVSNILLLKVITVL